jgi:uncharacterized protein (DUF1778 family)
MEKINSKKLKKVITLRLSEDDYQILNGFTNNEKRDVSRLLRNLIRAALDIVKENNTKK